jgi:hypothetical protein
MLLSILIVRFCLSNALCVLAYFCYSGYLVIVTEDAQWNYEIRGSYPDNINTNVKSKVDSNRTGAIPLVKL